MNKVYKLVWNAVQMRWVAVSEIGKGHKKSKALVVRWGMVGFLLAPSISFAFDANGSSSQIFSVFNSADTKNIRLMNNGSGMNIYVSKDESLGDVQVGSGVHNVYIEGEIKSYLAADGSQNTVTLSGKKFKVGTLDPGKGDNNILNLGNAEYMVDATTQNSIKHFDRINLKEDSMLTLREVLKLTADESDTQGVFNIDATSKLVIDGLESHGQAIEGSGTVSVTGNGEYFDFKPSVGSSFTGTVHMNAGTFNLDGDNAAALRNATLVIASNNSTSVGAGVQDIGGLKWEHGTLSFDVDLPGSADAFLESKLQVNNLDISNEGAIVLKFRNSQGIVETNIDAVLNLIDQQDVLRVQLIEANTVTGSGHGIDVIDQNGMAISAGMKFTIQQDGVYAATGEYDLHASFGEGDGVYLDYSLKKLDLQPGKNLTIDTQDAAKNNLFVQVTGTGSLVLRAADRDLIISNSDNDYTGVTFIETGRVKLGGDGALGQTQGLEMDAKTQLAMDGYEQTVGILNTDVGSLIDLQDGHLKVTGGGLVRGNLQGTGAVTLYGSGVTVDPLFMTAANYALSANVTVTGKRELVLKDIDALGSSSLELTDGQATLDGIVGIFNSSISGQGTVAVVNGSEVTLGPASPSFQGDFYVNHAHLTVNGPSYIGSASLDVDAMGHLTLDYADDNNDWVLINTITGDGALHKKGKGNVVLRDALEMGKVNLDEGHFLVADNLSSATEANLKASQVNIATAATLGGYGSVTGNVRNSGSLLVGSASTNQEKSVFGSFTVMGDYDGASGRVVINAALGDDNSQSDKLTITGAATGSTEVQVKNLGGAGGITSNGIRIIETGSSESAQTFTLQGNYVTAGQYEYSLNLHNNEITGDNWYLESKIKGVNPPQVEDGPVYSPDMGAYFGVQQAGNTLFTTRLEDREGVSGYKKSMEGSRNNIWVRTFSSHNQYDAMSDQLKTSGNSFVNQIGIGLGSLDQQSQTNFGVMGGIGRYSGDTHSRLTSRKSSSTAEGYSLGAYLTWYENPAEKRGAYVDGWMLWNHFKNQVDSVSGQRYKYNSSGITASVEAGTDIFLNESDKKKWWLQPQVQVVYQGVRTDTFKDNQGARIASGADNIQLRLGAKTYLEIPTQVGAFTNYRPYFALNYIRNSNPYEVKVNGDKYGVDGASNIKEIKLGIEGQITKNSQLWMNASHLKGNSGYQSYQGNIGWKYNF